MYGCYVEVVFNFVAKARPYSQSCSCAFFSFDIYPYIFLHILTFLKIVFIILYNIL